MRRNVPCLLWLFLSLFAGTTALPGLEVADVFNHHMVLQQKKPAPIWGTAEPGEKVTVLFAGVAKKTVADMTGRWLVRLDPMKASAESRALTVKGGDTTIILKDVLVGDVWIAGGQSNMGRQVKSSWRPEDQVLDYNAIRYLAVKSRGTKYPASALEGEWFVCTKETTPDCCAVGFFFAERLYRETGVPQGLLWNAWGGSVAKEWIPRAGWHLRPALEETARQVDAWYPETPIGRATFEKALADIKAWRGKAQKAVEQGHPFPFPQPRLPEPDDRGGTGRGITCLYNGRTHPLVPYAIAGILWWQGESDYANRRYLPEIEAMVASWRDLFACPGEKPEALPFYFVQMQRSGSYMSPDVRNRQFQSYFTIPNAGMAVLMDIDIQLHPWNKYDPGRRLALWALAKDYGRDLVFSGPLYAGHRVDDNKVIVSFTHTHGGLVIGEKEKLAAPRFLNDGKLINLEVLDAQKKWHAALSRIEGDKLIAWAEGVDRPAGVRYCWKSISDAPFLYNRAGLPAAQFNTTTPYAIKK